jgi:hypothetical protein
VAIKSRTKKISELAAKVAAAYKVNLGNKWIPYPPSDRQKLFLSMKDEREILYGGAAGGGKSVALLMAALEYVDVPGYSALILRRTYQDLVKPGALIDLAKDWLMNTAADWNETKKCFTFPSGATLTFGYLEKENDKYNYQGSQYHFVGFDELTQFKETWYLYLFSRLRRTENSTIPIRMRATSNPGGIGGKWVYDRFIPKDFTPSDAEDLKVFWKDGVDGEGTPTRRPFIPARLIDNPALDHADYVRSMSELDPITREQLLKGEWHITERGDIYPIWNEAYHVITWSQFESVFKVRNIPSHWLRGVFMDCGTTEGHPNIVSWFAAASDNSPMPGTMFLYRGYSTYGKTIREIATHILSVSGTEKDKINCWRMSHEANSERISLNRDFNLPFTNWKPDRNRGIAQVRNYLEIRYKKQVNPFNNSLMGRPTLFLIVDDDQLITPVDDRGLARWREEFPSYHYQVTSGGLVQPYPLFNDAMDTVRGAGAEYFAPILGFTTEELIQQKMAQVMTGKTFDDILNMPPDDRGPAIHAWRLKEAEIRRSQVASKVTSNIVKWRRMRHQ